MRYGKDGRERGAFVEKPRRRHDQPGRTADVHRKYLLILCLLVLTPLLAFFAVGRRLVFEEQDRTRRQFEELLRANLLETDRSISAYFGQLEQRLLRQRMDVTQPAELRAWQRREPLFEQIFVLAADGSLAYPDPSGELTSQETNYLMKVEALISDRSLLRQRSSQIDGQAGRPEVPVTRGVRLWGKRIARASENRELTSRETSQDHGWHRWYWGQGIQLIHWRSLPDGGILAIGMQRARWMADVIALLPDSPSSTAQVASSPAQIRLVDAEGRPIYVWGAREVARDARPIVSLHLGPPLKPWQLEHFGPVQTLSTGTSATLINLIGAGGLLFTGLAALAYYLSQEIQRQTRDARQRVNFVNQVSHELKTPLTNIRMYADLLEQDLQRLDTESDERAQTHLAVITGESSRLSRLINNVLSFARLQRGSHRHRVQQRSIDEIIREVVEQFRPSLDQLEMIVTLDLRADRRVIVDVDALEQVLGNLVSNVEKYAVGGKHVRISSRRQRDKTQIDVSDAGPGISRSFAKRIFEPFERASDHIESATGTGIGLPIARGLARQCGGDLELLESASGATFRITLPTPDAEPAEGMP